MDEVSGVTYNKCMCVPDVMCFEYFSLCDTVSGCVRFPIFSLCTHGNVCRMWGCRRGIERTLAVSQTGSVVHLTMSIDWLIAFSVISAGDAQSETMPNVANPSIAPSIGDASLGMSNSLSASSSHMDRVGVLRDSDSVDRDSSSNRAMAGSSLNGSICGNVCTNRSVCPASL